MIMPQRFVDGARHLGQEHGAKDMDLIAAQPRGIEKLTVAYATLGRTKLVGGLKDAATRRATDAVLQDELLGVYRDAYCKTAIECVERLIFTVPEEG